jgi:Reverse transcriptase (RNA-dependent DNA polymerase)
MARPRLTIPTEANFEQFTLVQGSKSREIFAPNAAMREVQEVLVRAIRPHLSTIGGVSVGARPGTTLAHNLIPHQESGGRNYALFDISNAYPSVDVDRLAKYLDWGVPNPFRYSWREVLELTVQDPNNPDGGLVQGPNAVPLLFDYFLNQLDYEIYQYCNGKGQSDKLQKKIRFTRWIDDYTFSAPDIGLGHGLKNHIDEMLGNYGLTLNQTKNQFRSLDRGPVTITGMSMHPDGHFQLSHELAALYEVIMDDIESRLGNGFSVKAPKLTPAEQYLAETSRDRAMKVAGQLSVFDTAEFVIAQTGPITLRDFDNLSGYNGLLQATHDPSRDNKATGLVRLSPLERHLSHRYLRLRETIGKIGGTALKSALKERSKGGSRPGSRHNPDPSRIRNLRIDSR